MRKVYIINKGGHDYTPAEKFGDLVYLSEGLLQKYNTSQMYRLSLERMRDSEPSDYIVLTSLSTFCAIACSVFAHKHGRLNLLLYKDDDYVERQLVIDTEVPTAV